MKKLIIAMTALAAATAVTAQTAPTPNPSYEESVQVNGKAEKKITPDEIHVAITLKDNEPKGQSVDALETRMKREFSSLGLDLEKSLKVTSMTNAPRKKRDVDTYRSYELTVTNAGTLSSVFEVLGEMGVSTANVTRVTHSRIDEYRREVRVAAIKNARAIAAELAEAVGQGIGAAVWIVDNGFYESSPVPMYKTRAMAADALYMSATDESVGGQSLEMQEITLTYNVMAKFVLNR